MFTTITTTPRATARLTGMAYLGIIMAGLFAEFFVRMSLVAPGDAATTAANIDASSMLFRTAIAADLVMVALDIGVAVGFYLLLRSVHRPLAILAAAFRLIQAAALAANLSNLVDALQYATVADGLGGIGADVLHGLTLSALETHALAYDIALVFFAISCIVLGRLLRGWQPVPRPIAVGLSVAGTVYLVGSFAAVVSPDLAAAIDPLYGLTVVAEVAAAIWLTARNPATQDSSADITAHARA